MMVFPEELNSEGNHYVKFNIVRYTRPSRSTPATENARGSIVLPMPMNLTASYNAAWNSSELGMWRKRARCCC